MSPPIYAKMTTIRYPFVPMPNVVDKAETKPEIEAQTLFVNAAPNAPVKAWKTAVIAVADAGKGAVWVSSPLFKLDVAPPMVTADLPAPPAVEEPLVFESYPPPSRTPSNSLTEGLLDPSWSRPSPRAPSQPPLPRTP